jgi:hypothetical protein
MSALGALPRTRTDPGRRQGLLFDRFAKPSEIDRYLRIAVVHCVAVTGGFDVARLAAARQPQNDVAVALAGVGGRDAIKDCLTRPDSCPNVPAALAGKKTVSLRPESTITCPKCGRQAIEVMPTDACQIVYDCKGCGVVLKPLVGDCCVFCSYGDVPCPPIQEARAMEVSTKCCGAS